MASSDEGVLRSAQLEERPPFTQAELADTAVAEVSGASRRLRALAALSGSLTDALAPKDAADLVEQKALSALGATSAVVVTFGSFPSPRTSPNESSTPAAVALHVLHAVGLPAEVRAALDELPLDAEVPFADVARTGEPLFLDTATELKRYPEWGAAMLQAGARAAAIVPVWANGELRGVLGLAWPRPQTFDEDERAFVLTLGVMCAQAILRAHLRGAELRAREAAEEANQSKAHFVATISHELRTPMNAILGYTELVRDGTDGAVTALQQDHLGRVRASGHHLLGLIEELLGYARLEAAEEVVRPERVPLAEVVEQSLQMVRPIVERKGLRMRLEAPPEPVALYTDPRKLRQILVNLLANAAKFTEVGEVVLLVRVEGTETSLRIHIEVSDTGCGMAIDSQARAFDPFWQADPTAKTSDGSTGLGLSVARQLARLLGGDLELSRSVPGEGSTFVLSLPAIYPGGAVHAAMT